MTDPWRARMEQTVERLERVVADQQATIADQQQTITDQQADIESHRETIAQLQAPSNVAVSRRSALQAGGVLGLLGLGAGVASANPSGQVGTAGRPLETLYTQQIQAPDGGTIGTENTPMETVYAEQIGSSTGELAVDAGLDVDGDVRTTGHVRKEQSVAFYVYHSSDSTLSSEETIPFDATAFDHGDDFDTSNHVFEVPLDGVYILSMHMICDNGMSNIRIRMRNDGDIISELYNSFGDGQSWVNVSGASVHHLEAGDEIYFTPREGGVRFWGTGEPAMNYFTGALLYAV